MGRLSMHRIRAYDAAGYYTANFPEINQICIICFTFPAGSSGCFAIADKQDCCWALRYWQEKHLIPESPNSGSMLRSADI